MAIFLPNGPKVRKMDLLVRLRRELKFYLKLVRKIYFKVNFPGENSVFHSQLKAIKLPLKNLKKKNTVKSSYQFSVCLLIAINRNPMTYSFPYPLILFFS